jgi:membrane protein insertase Oxa1/YidC/SpoIIIJ
MRYMGVDQFSKDTQKLGDTRMKYMMPLGWGWAFPFVKYTAMALVAAKTALSIPWMSFFILSGIFIRIIFMPLMIRQMVLIQRMAKVSPNIRLLTFCVVRSDMPLSRKAYYYLRSLFRYCKDVNVNPFVFVAYNLFQLPVFFLMIMSIRKISYEQNLENTGMLWFTNLNQPDPYMILPLISLGLTYYNMGKGITKDNEHWFINRWRNFFQVLQIFYLPFTCMWPSVK